MMGKMVSLMNLVFLQEGEREGGGGEGEVSKDIWLNMWAKLGHSMKVGHGVVTAGLTGSPGLSSG